MVAPQQAFCRTGRRIAAGLGGLAGCPHTGGRFSGSHRTGGNGRHRGARHGADGRGEPGHLSHRNRTQRCPRCASGTLGHQDRPVGGDRRVRVGHRPLPGSPGGGRTPATGPCHLAAGYPGAGDDARRIDHGGDPFHCIGFRQTQWSDPEERHRAGAQAADSGRPWGR